MWQAHKRYSEFEALHNACGRGTEAQLPGKTLFGKNDEKVILDRMASLNEYMKALLMNDAVLENPILTAFLAKDQPLISEDHVIESWDAEWAGAFLGTETKDRDSMSSLRRKAILETGKKSAALLGQEKAKLDQDRKALGEMEAEKSALHSKLMEVSGDLRGQIKEVEANVSAMTDLVGAINSYELKINGNNDSAKMSTRTAENVPKSECLQRMITLACKSNCKA
jgi:hypothetical protein